MVGATELLRALKEETEGSEEGGGAEAGGASASLSFLSCCCSGGPSTSTGHSWRTKKHTILKL